MPAPRRSASALALLGSAAFALAACSGGPGADPSAPASTGAEAPPPPSGPADGAGSDGASPAASGAAKASPTTADGCKDLVTDIVNDPPLDGGVAMNNATTAGDAGGSDRLLPVMETIQKNRDAFRCCFDLWGREHAGQEAKIALTLELEPTGALKKASFKQAETDLKDAAVEACMSDVAKKLSYPPSPSGKETTYTHRFQFKARAR